MAEPLPLYVQDQLPHHPFDILLTRIAVPISIRYPDARTILESFIESQKAPAYDGPETSNSSSSSPSREPIDRYPHAEQGQSPDGLTAVKQQIVNELFNAIQREDVEAVTLLIQYNLVTANTIGKTGETPLVEAVLTKSITLVKVVLDLGADCNAFGRVVRDSQAAERTPLMLAASIGSLPIVKLLFEPPYSADDALVAPDGEIALRLAVENNHRAIVDYLPSRRAGGYLRFKTHNRRSIERIKSALRKIWLFIKFFIWDLPKFFVWTIPKHLVVLPVMRTCKWCWANRKKFGGWCKHQLTEMPKRIVRFGKATWNVAKKVPKAVWNAAKKVPKAVWNAAKKVPKAVWEAIKKTPEVIWKAIKNVWKAVKEMVKSLWKFLTVSIPNAIRTALKWAWDGISSLARAIGDIFLRFVSFLHTVIEGIVTFMRNVTLRDIWNAFCEILRAIFITFPKTLWTWIENFGEASYKVMKALFGSFGELLWYIAEGLKDLVVYIPTKLGVIVLSVGSSIAKAFTEIKVWISPKA